MPKIGKTMIGQNYENQSLLAGVIKSYLLLFLYLLQHYKDIILDIEFTWQSYMTEVRNHSVWMFYLHVLYC